jgi:hypothetical protein
MFQFAMCFDGMHSAEKYDRRLQRRLNIALLSIPGAFISFLFIVFFSQLIKLARRVQQLDAMTVK